MYLTKPHTDFLGERAPKWLRKIKKIRSFKRLSDMYVHSHKKYEGIMHEIWDGRYIACGYCADLEAQLCIKAEMKDHYGFLTVMYDVIRHYNKMHGPRHGESEIHISPENKKWSKPCRDCHRTFITKPNYLSWSARIYCDDCRDFRKSETMHKNSGRIRA